MTFSTNVPNASQSPGLFPAQSNTNFSRLKTIMAANHQFNDTAAANDGYHINMKMLPQLTPANDASVGQPFVNSVGGAGHLWWKDALNNVYQVTPTLPIRAQVNFSVNQGTFAVTINSSMNVATVTRDATGLYTIAFTSALPTNTYTTVGIAQPANTSSTRNVMLRGGAALGNAQSTAAVLIQIQNSSGSNSDPVSCGITIFGG